MPITRPWKIVGATAAIAGLGIAGASSGGIDLQDRADPVQLTAIPAALADTPAHTDDSPGLSPFQTPTPPPAPSPGVGRMGGHPRPARACPGVGGQPGLGGVGR